MRRSPEQRWLDAAAKVARSNQKPETVVIEVVDKLYVPITIFRGVDKVHTVNVSVHPQITVFPHRHLTSVGRLTMKSTRGNGLHRSDHPVAVSTDGRVWMRMSHNPEVSPAAYIAGSILTEHDTVFESDGWRAARTHVRDDYKVEERARALLEWATVAFAMDDEGNVYRRMFSPVFQLFCKQEYGTLSVTALCHDYAHTVLPHPHKEIKNLHWPDTDLSWVDTGLIFPIWEIEAMQALLQQLKSIDNVSVIDPVDFVRPDLREKIAKENAYHGAFLETFVDMLDRELLNDLSDSPIAKASSSLRKAAKRAIGDSGSRIDLLAAVRVFKEILAQQDSRSVFASIEKSSWPLPVSPFDILELRAAFLATQYLKPSAAA